MLKSCIEALASQMKLYRVKQRREAHKVISINKRYVFLNFKSSYVLHSLCPYSQHNEYLKLSMNILKTVNEYSTT